MLVILDTNILFSALISPNGIPGLIYQAWQDGRFTLVTCNEQLDELRAASRYPKLRVLLKPHLVGKMLNAMQRTIILKNVPRTQMANDPTDTYLLDLAEFAPVHYLITGDKRSGLLNRHRLNGAKILTASQFKKTVLE